MTDREENPIASGLIALVAVAVVVGLLAGIAALAGTRLLGIGDDGSDGSGEAGAGESLYLPEPVPTTQQSGPLVTLAPSETLSETATATVTESETVSETPTEEKSEITLSVDSNDVAPGEELRISGLYQEGEGAVLDIYYNVNGGGWDKFPLSTNVSGGIFAVDVVTWKEGTIKWRVEDPSTGRVSNAMTVHHG